MRSGPTQCQLNEKGPTDELIPVAFTDELREFKNSRLHNIVGDHATDLLD